MANSINFAKLLGVSALALGLAACGTDYREPVKTAEEAPKPDPRGGLKAGNGDDAGIAVSNLALERSIPVPEGFYEPNSLWSPAVERELARKQREGEPVERAPNPISFANSDLAFQGDYVFQGNFHGVNVFDLKPDNGAAEPEVLLSLVCPGGQGDVTVYGNLLFHSVEQNRARLDCGGGGVEGDSSSERFRGVRVFDISDIKNPRQVAAVQTCRGSHTHTLVPNPEDKNSIYIYNSGTAGVRANTELEGCYDGEPGETEDTALYSIDVIKVPLDKPEDAKIVNRPRIFADPETGAINGLWKGGKIAEDSQTSRVTNQCHDITVYPAYNLAAGACSGNGILLDISDPANPTRISDIADGNMAYWHSATFSNDAKKVLFTDEWGGGLGAHCLADEPNTWGADIITTIGEDGFEKRGFFKIPGVQSKNENCVAHNGMLIPVPGRDIFVQGWYSGGISVIDFTNPDAPFEIAFFDRGPLSDNDLYLGGYWAAYWHNGRIYGSEITRGLDIFRLLPSEHLTEAEIAAAELVQFSEMNTQTQEKITWPANPAVAEAYIQQLMRDRALDGRMEAIVARALEAWKDRSGTRSINTAAASLMKAARKATGATKSRMEALADQFQNAY